MPTLSTPGQRVDDSEATFARMQRLDVEFVTDPRDEPIGQVAVFIDVVGNGRDLLGPTLDG